MTRYVVQTSGGIGSWAAALRTVEAHGTADVDLLFADTQIEDGDAYRFLVAGSCHLFGVECPPDLLALLSRLPEAHEDLDGRKAGLLAIRERLAVVLPPLRWIADGRTPFEVFADVRYLGNSGIDPCSRRLKRELIAAHMAATYDPAETVCVVGIDWSERHRYDRLKKRYAEQGGWNYAAPLCDPPYVTKAAWIARARIAGLAVPRLYELGFAHNNCGGGCVKAGHGHWALLLRTLPEVFAWWEAQEEGMRTMLEKDVSMLSDRAGDGVKKPLTLRALRERIQAGGQIDLFDMGGCGCALPGYGDEAA